MLHGEQRIWAMINGHVGMILKPKLDGNSFGEQAFCDWFGKLF